MTALMQEVYFFLYGFWGCMARPCSVLLCILAAFGLPLLLQRPELRSRLRPIAQIGGPAGLLLLFVASYQLGAWAAGKDAVAREQREDFPSYSRAQIFLEKQDKRGKDLAKGYCMFKRKL